MIMLESREGGGERGAKYETRFAPPPSCATGHISRFKVNFQTSNIRLIKCRPIIPQFLDFTVSITNN